MNPFSYNLPKELIAQRPVKPYHQAKMLVVERKGRAFKDSVFLDISSYLSQSDIVVFNDTKVVKARLFGVFGDGGKAEVLLLDVVKEIDNTRRVYVALGRPMKKLREGRDLVFRGDLKGRIIKRVDEKKVLLELSSKRGLSEALEEAGVMPIPPYIRGGEGDKADERDYQTFFASHPGSVAAPTAGLHFTPEIMDRLRDAVYSVDFVTLHVGTPSFIPVYVHGKEGKTRVIPPAPERCVFSASLMAKIRDAKDRGGRVIAVGTTVVRALESMARVKCAEGEEFEADLFITPEYKFNLVDCLVTNFHQPGTTHMLIVEALMGRELLEESYHYALSNRYRFLSYGDGMLIL